MSKFEVQVTITFSNIMAFLVLVTSFIMSMYFKETTVFIFGLPISAGLIGAKQYFDVKKTNGNGNGNGGNGNGTTDNVAKG